MEKPLTAVVVGDGAVGKSTLCMYLANQPLGDLLSRSILESFNVLVKTKEGERNIVVYDTAGQEDNSSQKRSEIYRDASILIICYSCISPSSFENVTAKWLPELRVYNTTAPITLVSTKTDLVQDEYLLSRLAERGLVPVPSKSGKQLAKEIRAYDYLELSCTNETAPNCSCVVEQLFTDFIEEAESPEKHAKKSHSKKKKHDCVVV